MVGQDSTLPLVCSQFQQWRTIRQQSVGMEPLNGRGLRPRFGHCEVAPSSRVGSHHFPGWFIQFTMSNRLAVSVVDLWECEQVSPRAAPLPVRWTWRGMWSNACQPHRSDQLSRLKRRRTPSKEGSGDGDDLSNHLRIPSVP